MLICAAVATTAAAQSRSVNFDTNSIAAASTNTVSTAVDFRGIKTAIVQAKFECSGTNANTSAVTFKFYDRSVDGVNFSTNSVFQFSVNANSQNTVQYVTNFDCTAQLFTKFKVENPGGAPLTNFSVLKIGRAHV
mgnify:FL=1